VRAEGPPAGDPTPYRRMLDALAASGRSFVDPWHVLDAGPLGPGDPLEAEIVRAIFDLASRGDTAAEIAWALNARGFVRRSGRLWTPRRVAAVLSRADVYRTGVLRYGIAAGRNEDLVIIRSQNTADSAMNGQ